MKTNRMQQPFDAFFRKTASQKGHRSPMKLSKCLILAAFCALRIVAESPASAVRSSIEERKALVNQMVSARSKHYGYDVPILAFLGELPLDDSVVGDLVNGVATSTNSDFSITILVRTLFLTGKTEWKQHYDDLILPTLHNETYWFSQNVPNDDSMTSENHMILWMSSAWLLKQREGWEIGGATLRQRLVHYLTIKIEYGFYEFLSRTYWPFTFQGLMNLVDFCEEDEIRALAEQAVRRLVKDNLLFVNSKGIKYSVAGRDYREQFIGEPYTHNQDGVIYVLTGKAPKPVIRVRASSFLTTSSIDFSDLVEAWEPYVDTTFEYGHTLEEGFEIHSELDRYDRIVFQFSAGAYFNPLIAQDVVDFLAHFAPITFNKDFVVDEWIKMVPAFLAPLAASAFESVSLGADCSGAKIRLYRSEGSMLSSVQNFWPGYLGFQTFVWMGVADDVAVWTQAGPVYEDWLDKSRDITNTNLPSIQQVSNVALIMYKPKLPQYLLQKDVALYWPEERFDEVVTVPDIDSDSFGLWGWIIRIIQWFLGQLFGSSERIDGTWILGRKNDSYIAVYRPCGERRDRGWFACEGDAGQQTWATVVGDATQHGSFQEFARIIEAATVQETFRDDDYSASVTADGKTVRLTW